MVSVVQRPRVSASAPAIDPEVISPHRGGASCHEVVYSVVGLSAQLWRCLWRGFSQITMTRPWRRITLHLSQIFFTLGLTFMELSIRSHGLVARIGCAGAG